MNTQPFTNSKGVISGNCWRIGVLSDSLLRLEWSDTGEFNDDATLMAVNRDFGTPPEYSTSIADGLLTVETTALRLTYDMRPFSKEGLSIVVKGVKDTKTNTWHFGDAQEGNMKGTARTLDWADGAIPLNDGVVSRDGWSVLDDSNTCLFADNGDIKPRKNAGIDLYFFGHGHRYADAVADFCRLSGRSPLLPRYALGNWWSRFHRYTSEEYVALMDRFKSEGIPFTTSVIDMDWHLVDDVDPKYGSGWTGYTWNRKLIPDPQRFLGDLHERGCHVSLNVHPRDGIRAFEDCYPSAAKTMGISPDSGEPVEFDLTDPRFVRAYFDIHHDLEADGVDFWWIDWQQGGVTRQPGLDPLWVLNHMHYCDSARDGRWPLILSRFAGPGSQRYPVGFSGDTIVTWESLRFQPYFTATASNIGYGWWSHDIGGHMFGYRDEELEARWYQLGAFSPINRLHSTDSPFNGKEPWNFRPETECSMDDALRLRHELLPYLYTMNWRAAAEGRPLVEPMYWQSPENVTAYGVEHEFRFGTELIVAPIVTPSDRNAQLAKTDVWLPQGTWFDFFTGRRYEAGSAEGRKFEAWRGLDGIPVFAKAGGIVPLQPLDEELNGSLNSVDNPRYLEVAVFPGANGAFDLKEDDGTNQAQPSDSALAVTHMDFRWEADGAVNAFEIAPVAGNVAAVPQQRTWTVTFTGVAPVAVDELIVTVGGAEVVPDVSYDTEALSLSVTVADAPVTQAVSIHATNGLRYADDPAIEDAFTVLYNAQIDYLAKERAYRLIKADGARALNALHTLESTKSSYPGHEFDDSHMPESVIQAIAEPLLRGL